ncbi:MAG: acyl-CoA dehydrogenase family protein [Acidimicrobiales bacterium]|nr:acyl-CoA dehydrogenase family protein [Acidimicrobiales bacterium]
MTYSPGPPDPVSDFLPRDESGLKIAPLLDAIEAQSQRADATRSLDGQLLAAIRGSDFMRMSASDELGGSGHSMHHIGLELEAISPRCPSTAWCLWNHLCVFHLFVGSLGPDHSSFLTGIVERGEWVSFPAGAGSGVHGRVAGDVAVLNGRAAFGTGARYADWCGVVFAVVDESANPVKPLELRFTMVPTTTPGVGIDPTWDGSGLRASATDDVHYADVEVPLDRCVEWFGANRAKSLRTVPVINHRYREDWVGLSDLWLGSMAVGVVRAALSEAAAEFRTRKAIMGRSMINRPTVQTNIGRALAFVASARAAIEEATHEVDRRIERAIPPTDADYYRQQAIVTMAVEHLEAAMALLGRTYGGNGQRESSLFERRSRDFRSMPLHINVHHDRVTHQLGRLALGIDLDPF